MRCRKSTTIFAYSNRLLVFALCTILLPSVTNSAATATVKDIFNLNTQLSPRVPRDSKYYSGRYGSSSSNPSPLSRAAIKPEESPEAREGAQAAPVEKRCTRCDSNYNNYDSFRYDSRPRYDDRRYRDRYEYDDRRYDKYDRYDDGRYDRFDRRPSYERYDRDRYSGGGAGGGYDRDRYSGGGGGGDRYDRYNDRERYYDRDYDRGFGYDNRGYDYRDRGYDDYRDQASGYGGGAGNRGYYSPGKPDSGYWGSGTGGGYATGWNYGGRDDYRDREPYKYDSFKPWDETYRGISGWDSNGRGYYFASGIPEVGATYWGAGGATQSNRYGSGGGGGSGAGGGGGGGYYRPREPNYDGYRATSYLYGRPSSTTTAASSGDGDNVTQSPQADNSSG